MDINWYGYACFRIREPGMAIITDPFGLALPRVRADVVTFSQPCDQENRPTGIRGSPPFLQTPGEYEIGGVFITGILTSENQLPTEPPNITYVYDWDGLRVCHLGKLQQELGQNHIELLDQVNVLLIPVDHKATISADQAAEIINTIEPNIVIPMHYSGHGPEHTSSWLAKLADAMGTSLPKEQESIRVNTSHLPEEPQIVLLTCK